MSDLPSPHPVKLGECVYVATRSKAEPSEIAGEAWLLELEDIERDTGRLLQRVTKAERAPRSEKTRFLAGDILYGKLRPYLNKVIQATDDGYCSTEIVPLRAPQALESRYLYYWMQHPDFRDYANVVSQGTNMPRVSTAKLRDAPFLFASASRQHSIADYLDDVFLRIETIRDAVAQVPSALDLVWAHLAERTLVELAEREPPVRLEDVVVRANYGTSKKSSREGEVPVLRMGNLQDGEIDWSDLAYSSDHAEIDKYSLNEGDLLFNRTNSPELVGKTAVYRGGRRAIFAGYLIRLQLAENVLPEYVSVVLNSPLGRAYCRNAKVDGLSQSNINLRSLLNFRFTLPSVATQEAVVNGLMAAKKHVRRLQQAGMDILEGLPSVRDIALRRAFAGLPSSRSAFDEADSLLLEGIEEEVRSMAQRDVVGARERRNRSKVEHRRLLSRGEIAGDHLSQLIQNDDGLRPIELWEESRLSIDDFYDQLRDEVIAGLIVERRTDGDDSERRLVRR
ncbi:type I restriction enzyme, S subunit [Micromonospora rhizosphaerae]|uniref:Type I restriction enzyme, S subunit n=1 Tax=Micromonospora rhizosphaerae TaxID=568872 RepID=A0A1C6RT52_9ACTN|nr:hypothetical protein [Micromonospora rhizosphaerae]SCL20351.1 type I restriction enzyme, S subunit [Micromonospora rhizosphaerae]